MHLSIASFSILKRYSTQCGCLPSRQCCFVIAAYVSSRNTNPNCIKNAGTERFLAKAQGAISVFCSEAEKAMRSAAF